MQNSSQTYQVLKKKQNQPKQRRRTKEHDIEHEAPAKAGSGGGQDVHSLATIFGEAVPSAEMQNSTLRI